MKKTSRQSLIAITTSVVLAASIFAGLGDPWSPKTAQAQANPQDTDLFTGQFIPAYLGAAYDPTEAYKQMAGTPVYVFSYDTFGKIVNNFAYKTEVKADGSFQAAGLPNASHYGICVPVSDEDPISPFRPPMPNDLLQTAFAYNQAEYPAGSDKTKPVEVNSQIQDQKVTLYPINTVGKDELHGCRTFLTSSKTVDIANHVNVFPLVPNSVLSVIINDSQTGSDDFNNANKPYEIYAQRVVVNNAPENFQQDQQTQYKDCYNKTGQGATIIDQLRDYLKQVSACKAQLDAQASQYNNVSYGPVIRGRTIPYTGSDAAAPGGSIFQAYAPRGIYAITYWRPDDRDATKTTTYLNYNGTDNLNTPYNGVAFEQVDYPDYRIWGSKASRDPSPTAGNAWISQKGSVNVWGLVTAGSKEGVSRPQVNVPVAVDDENLQIMDIANRKCGGANGATGGFGIYFFSSACKVQDKRLYSTSTTISTDQTAALASTDAVSLSVNGIEGPSRQDLPLGGISPSVSGVLLQGGKPLASINIDLLQNGARLGTVARTNAAGQFFIPTSYFSRNPSAKYVIDLSNNIPENFNGKLVNKQYALNFAGDPSVWLAYGSVVKPISVDNTVNPILAWLGDHPFSSLVKQFRIPVAYAETVNSQAYPVDPSAPNGRGPFAFYFDLTQFVVPGQKEAFTINNYNLEDAYLFANNDHGSIFHLTQGDAIANSHLLTKYGNGFNGYLVQGETISAQGSATALSDTATRNNREIIGVILRKRQDGFIQQLNHAFDTDYNDTIKAIPVGKPQGFTLVVKLVSKAASQKAQSSNSNNDNGQDPSTSPTPPVYTAQTPVTIYRISNDQYTMSYGKVVLQTRNFNCAADGNNGESWLSTQLVSDICQVTYGVVTGITTVVGYAATNLYQIDRFSPDAVVQFWNMMRNVVNGLSVLVLIIAGLAIMFKYEPKTFQLQSVLTKLLIVIVAVNFSILIIQAAIDITNVMALGGYFLLTSVVKASGGLTVDGAEGIGTVLVSAGIGLVTTALATGGASIAGLLLGILVIGAAAVFLAFRVILDYLIRVGIVMLCIITAPAAIAATLLPGTAKYFTKWRQLLIGTLVAQIAFTLILGVSVGFLQQALGVGQVSLGLIEFALALMLLYLAVKAPSKVAAAFGAGLTAGLSASALKLAQSAPERYRKWRIGKDQQKAAEENYVQYRKMKGMGEPSRIERAKFRINQKGKNPFNVDLEELYKAREHGASEARRTGFYEFEKYGEDVKKQGLSGFWARRVGEFHQAEKRREARETSSIIGTLSKEAGENSQAILGQSESNIDTAFKLATTRNVNADIVGGTVDELNEAYSLLSDEARARDILGDQYDDQIKKIRQFSNLYSIAINHGGYRNAGEFQDLLSGESGKAVQDELIRMGATDPWRISSGDWKKDASVVFAKILPQQIGKVYAAQGELTDADDLWSFNRQQANKVGRNDTAGIKPVLRNEGESMQEYNDRVLREAAIAREQERVQNEQRVRQARMAVNPQQVANEEAERAEREGAQQARALQRQADRARAQQNAADEVLRQDQVRDLQNRLNQIEQEINNAPDPGAERAARQAEMDAINSDIRNLSGNPMRPGDL